MWISDPREHITPGIVMLHEINLEERLVSWSQGGIIMVVRGKQPTSGGGRF